MNGLIDLLVARRDRRLAAHESRRERHRKALLRPAARAEWERAMAECEATAQTDAETWLLAVVWLAFIEADGEDVELEDVQAHLDAQLRLLTAENLAARLPLFEITEEQLRVVVDGIWITRHGLDDA